MIPKRVIHDINCIWRAYLCSGEYYSQRPDNIKWDQVCTPKEAGGSEVRRIIRWNSTALGRYVRDVFAKKDYLFGSDGSVQFMFKMKIGGHMSPIKQVASTGAKYMR